MNDFFLKLFKVLQNISIIMNWSYPFFSQKFSMKVKNVTDIKI